MIFRPIDIPDNLRNRPGGDAWKLDEWTAPIYKLAMVPSLHLQVTLQKIKLCQVVQGIRSPARFSRKQLR
ncbi:MAG: hypothetical protein CMN76_00845 [Spirochaetaceae bacterium]|nr:hypothetical protein [Spirochaetaceae bacterium]